MRDALRKEAHTLREVVLLEPLTDTILLHVGPRRHIDNQVTQLEPVAHHVDGGGTHARIRPRQADRSGKRSINREDATLDRGPAHDEFRVGLITR